MAEFPALPVFTDAMIADTQHLSHQEFGLYVRLLMYAWRSSDCSLPTERKKLSRMVHISHTSRRKFEMVEDVLSQFFFEKNGKFFQKRLLKEKTFLEEKKQKDSLNGELGAVIKSLKKLGMDLSPADLTLKENDKPRLLETLRERLRVAQAPTPTPTPLEERVSVSNNESSSEKESPTSTARAFAFAGAVIRLNQSDFEAWRTAFKAIPDLRAELQARDDFLKSLPVQDQKRWFMSTSSYLRNKNQKILEDQQDIAGQKSGFAC